MCWTLGLCTLLHVWGMLWVLLLMRVWLLGRYVPLRIGAWFAGVGVHNVVEMDWWDEVTHKDSQVTITMTPAQVRAPL